MLPSSWLQVFSFHIIDEIQPGNQSKIWAALTPYYNQRKKYVYGSCPSQNKKLLNYSDCIPILTEKLPLKKKLSGNMLQVNPPFQKWILSHVICLSCTFPCNCLIISALCADILAQFLSVPQSHLPAAGLDWGRLLTWLIQPRIMVWYSVERLFFLLFCLLVIYKLVMN